MTQWLARLGALSLLVLFFRNIHGLFSYDLWMKQPPEASHPLGRWERLVVVVVAPIAVLLGPFLAIDILCHHYSSVSDKPDVFVPLLWLLLLGVYVLWDIALWWRSDPKTGGDPELHSVASRWMALDSVGWVVLILLVFPLVGWPRGLERWQAAALVTFTLSLTALVTTIIDYVWNRRYYFGW